MPKSDTWPGGIFIESVSGMDSAGSCDSVLSLNSGYSDDSLEYLSAEERACLMFLKETIESLEVEDDSGLSNDEPDCLSNGLKDITAHQTKSQELSAHEDPNKVIGRDNIASLKYLVPTPLVLASRNVKLIEKAPEEVPVAILDAPDGFRSSPIHQEPVSVEGPSRVGPAKANVGLLSDVDLPPSFIPEPPVKTSLTSDSKAKNDVSKSLDVKSQVKELKVSSEVPTEFIPPPSLTSDSKAKNDVSKSIDVKSQVKELKVSLEVPTEFIPPPSDFMDEPPPTVYDEPPEWIPELPKVEPHTSDPIKPTEVAQSQVVDPVTLSHNEIENLRQKKSSHLTPIMVAQHSSVDKPMTPSPSSEHFPTLPKEYSDCKSPPAVAPKPKKLPSNIILKSHKDSGTTHSLLPQGERGQMDPQKIRMEALKKLGLLKNEEIETGPGVSPSHSPTFKTKIPQQSPSHTTAPVVAIQELSRVSESPAQVDVHLPIETLKQGAKSREGSLKKTFQIKSASLDRAGTVPFTAPQSTNPDRTHVELSPGQLRKSQARSPSLGSSKDFGISHQAEESSKSLHAAVIQPINDSQKLPRHNGISVMISPNGKNGENRREALKKLGLLRD